MLLQVECFLQKMVYRQSTIHRQTHKPTHVSQMLVSPVSASKVKFQYLHGSRFWVALVLCLSEAGCSGLPWGVLPAVLGVTIPRQSHISRHTIHRWHWSWRGGIPNSSHGFIHLTLLYIRIDGKQGSPVPFPIPGGYQINWIGPLFHNIFPIFPSILNFVMIFEGIYMD